MVTCEEFEQEIQEALVHLYDADYQPSESLCVLTGCDPREGVFGVQSTITSVIKDLEPSPDTPSSARTRLIYDLLHNRFILKLTQEETAERLHLSVATAWRAQREAIHALARGLWERNIEHKGPVDTHTQGDEEQQRQGTTPDDAQALDWRSQTARELARNARQVCRPPPGSRRS